MKKLLVLLWVGAMAPAASPATSLLLVSASSRADVDALLRAGIDVDTCVAPTPAGVWVYADAPARERLARLGFTYEVLYEDARDAVAWTADWTGPPYRGGDAIPYDHYLTYAEFTAAMQELASTYSDIARLTSLGKTVEGRDIWALKVTGNPEAEEIEPELRLVGAHHGNEKISYMVALYAAERLCAEYQTNPEVKQLVDGAEIWCIPMLNADGVESNSRYNAHGVDLNRNYSYAWLPGSTSGDAPFSEPETRAVRDLSQTNAFVMSHSFHSGAKYVNYVWNYQAPLPNDLDVILYLSDLYSSHTGYPKINGYAWYETHGDLNDWSYGERGDPDDTIEVYSPGYNPPASGILAVCQLNWPAILSTFRSPLAEVVKGTVKDADTLAPLAATVTPLEIDWPAYTDPARGDYYKMLRPGTYTLKASAQGYASGTEAGVVVREGQPTVVDFLLHKTGVPVKVISFTATRTAAGVRLAWETTTAVAGFNLYRAGGERRERINPRPITGRSPYRYLEPNVPAERTRYLLAAVDARGREEVVAACSLDEGNGRPAAFALGPARPNPARDAVTVPFSVAAPGRVRLAAYDLAGRLVAVWFEGDKPAGEHQVQADVKGLAPGLYLYRLETATSAAARRLVISY